MMTIDDPTPPPPKKYIENSIESGDGRKTCIACSKHHGSENALLLCMEREIVNLRDKYRAQGRRHEEELAKVRREVRGEASLRDNPGGVMHAPIAAKGDEK